MSLQANPTAGRYRKFRPSTASQVAARLLLPIVLLLVGLSSRCVLLTTSVTFVLHSPRSAFSGSIFADPAPEGNRRDMLMRPTATAALAASAG